jgi:hypothetical protein
MCILPAVLNRRWLAVVAGVTLTLRAPSFFRAIMDIDEGSYAAIACRMLDGGLPYRDGVENKFPAIFYTYWGIFALFGRYNMLAVHLCAAAVALATALVCGAIAHRFAGERAFLAPQAGRADDHRERAAVAAALFYAVFSTVYYPKMLAGNTEMFLVLPASLAVLAYLGAAKRRSLYLVAGALAGVTLLYKQVAGSLFAALALDRVLRRRPVGDLVLLGAGLCAVVGGAVGWLAHRGILDDAVFWSWTYVFRHYLPSGTRDHGFAFNFVISFVPFAAAVAPPLVLAVGYARERALSAVWLWLGGAAAASLVGGRMYGHYFLMMVPPLAVLGGVGAARWLDGPAAAARRRLLVGVSAFLAAGFFVYACLFEAATESFWRPSPDYLAATDWLRAHSSTDDRVFVWGWFPPLYVRSDRCPSTRFVYTHVLSGSPSQGAEARGHSVPEGWDMLMHDLEAAPPRYVLDTSHGDYSYAQSPLEAFPRLWEFVRVRYVMDAEVAGVRFYRRR